MKQLHFSEKCLRKRIEINNKELFDDLYQKEKNIILYSGHYGNFEWVTILHKLLNSNTHYFFSPIYQKLKNTYFDILYITLRNKYGAISIEQKKAIRRILTLQKSNEKAIFLLVSDQRPRRNNLNYWITFMNQDTPVITGTEHIAKQTNSAAVYLEIQKISRGHYAWSFTLMEENPKILPNYKLTDMYFSLLEKTIRKAPQYYLWTHKRWLYKKENGN
jgi:KDO2-lipid IV(A) lauroyltransferase